MLNKMALNLAQTFYENNDTAYDYGDVEVYAYGLELFLSAVFEVFAVLILGILFGRFFETIAFFAAFIPLRSYAGGYHAKTHLGCFFVLLVIYSLILLVLHTIPISFIGFVSLICVGVSVFPILKFAPLADKNKPIGPQQYKEFRKKSVLIFLVQSIIIIGLSSFVIVSHVNGFAVHSIVSFICLGFTLGQLSSSGSLVVAKIRNMVKNET